jgi:hypothetical protein
MKNSNSKNGIRKEKILIFFFCKKKKEKKAISIFVEKRFFCKKLHTNKWNQKIKV